VKEYDRLQDQRFARDPFDKRELKIQQKEKYEQAL